MPESVWSSAFDFCVEALGVGSVESSLASLHQMVDIAHIAGLIAGGQHPSPAGYAHFVTTTTHKTLRGPRGGIIMCDEELATAVDKAVFPGVQGGPLEHIIAGKAVALLEAQQPAFKEYAAQVVENSKCLASELIANGIDIADGGTHLAFTDGGIQSILHRCADFHNHGLEGFCLGTHQHTSLIGCQADALYQRLSIGNLIRRIGTQG